MVVGRALVLYFAAPLCDAGRGRVPLAQVPLDVAGLNPVESPTNSSQPLAHTAHPSLPPSVGAPAPCVDDDAGIARSSGGLLASCNVRPPFRVSAPARALGWLTRADARAVGVGVLQPAAVRRAGAP